MHSKNIVTYYRVNSSIISEEVCCIHLQLNSIIEMLTGVTERRNLRDVTLSTGLATFLRSRQIFFPSLFYCPHEPNSDALKMEATSFSKTPEETFHIIGA